MTEVWFDTRTGDQLIGEAAIAQRMEESGPGDIMPLSEMVLGEHDVEPGQYEKMDLSTLSIEDCIAYGHWVIKVLSADERYHGLKRSHIERLGTLGIGPGRSAIVNRFGKMFDNYRLAVGEPLREKEHYGDWTRRQIYEYGTALASQLGKKPTEGDYLRASQSGKGPSPWIMKQRAGLTPGSLGELMGYPNVYLWDEEDFVAWGAKAMDVNNGALLTSRMINILAERDRGPGHATIRDQFGSIAEFQHIARQRYVTDPTSRAVRDETARRRVADLHQRKYISEWLVKYLNNKNKALVFIAQYDIARDMLRDNDELRSIELALQETDDFMSMLQEVITPCEKIDIELSAIVTGHTDDIWQLSEKWRRHLRVTRRDLKYERPTNASKFAPPRNHGPKSGTTAEQTA